MSCQEDVVLLLLYTDVHTVTFGRMNANNANLSNQVR
jgi:hypothetical protein